MTDRPEPPVHVVHEVDVARGQTIIAREFGPRDAPAVVYHHGTPSCSYEIPSGFGNLPPGIRLVTFDRPGYGASATVPGRRVVDAGRWSEAIADTLGLGRFAVMGTSGGGPHTAATAAVLGDRITRVCISVGLGPIGMAGFDWEVGSPTETIAEMRCAIEGEEQLRAFVEAQMQKEDPLADWMDQLPASDQEILSRPSAAAEEEWVNEEAIGHGIDGWVEDDLAFFHRHWGVDLGDVTAETLLLYGGADVLVPHAHGDAMQEAIGHGQLVKVPGAGHWMRDVEPDVLRWLVGEPGGGAFALAERFVGDPSS